MKIIKWMILLASLLIAGIVSSANAGTLIGAVDVTTNMGEPYPTDMPIKNIINQSGLPSHYTSGAADFNSYVATTTHSIYANTEWFSDEWSTNTPPAGSSITFTLGNLFSIDKLAIWNEDSQGINGFKVFTSTDNNSWVGVGTFNAANVPIYDPGNPLTDSYHADVFLLSSTTLARFVKIEILSVFPNEDNGFNKVASLGEVAFSAVPEPASLLLFGTGLLGLAGIRRRK